MFGMESTNYIIYKCWKDAQKAFRSSLSPDLLSGTRGWRRRNRHPSSVSTCSDFSHFLPPPLSFCRPAPAISSHHAFRNPASLTRPRPPPPEGGASRWRLLGRFPLQPARGKNPSGTARRSSDGSCAGGGLDVQATSREGPVRRAGRLPWRHFGLPYAARRVYG